MKAEERRAIIAQTLTADRPISATALAGRFSVSRQIIVGDIALLRAAGLTLWPPPGGINWGDHRADPGSGLPPHRRADRGGTADHGGPWLHRHRRGGGPPHLWAAYRPAEPGLPVRCGAVCGEDSGDRPPLRPYRGGSPPPPPLPRRRGLPPGVPGAGQAGRPLHPKRGNWGLTRP